MKKLNQNHYDLIQNSQISDDVISRSGMFSASKSDQQGEFGFNIGQSGIGFPYHDLDGNYLGFRMRKDKKDDYGKYLQAKNKNLNCYFIKSDIESLMNTALSLFITEGEKKCNSISSNIDRTKSCSIAYPGCYNYKSKSQGGISEIWHKIPLVNRTVFFVPDTDYFENYNVYSAGLELCHFLYEKKAIIHIVDLRIDSVNEKIGADDFINRMGFNEFKQRCLKPLWVLKKDILNDSNPKSSLDLSKLLSQIVLTENEIEIDELLGRLKEIFKVNLGTLKNTLKSHKSKFKAFKPKLVEEDNEIFYDSQNDSTLTVIRKIHSISAKHKRVFLEPLSQQIIFHQDGSDRFKYITNPSEYSANLGKIVDFCYMSKDKDGNIIVAKRDHVPEKIIASILTNPIEFGNYRELEFSSNSPIYTKDFGLIQGPGYSKDAKVYVACEKLELKEDLFLINKILNSFPFKDNASRSNALGFFISQTFFLNYFKGKHPAVTIKGDSQNLGKSTLAKISSIIANLNIPIESSLSNNEEELEKLIASFVQSSNVVFFDNIRTTNGRVVSSPVLERLITSELMGFRSLGHNRLIMRPNNVQFIFTLNEGKFSYDLLLRMMMINLSIESKTPIDPDFDVELFVHQNRIKILSELSYMVQKWILLDKPEMKVKFPKFPTWGKAIGGILEASGFKDFLGNFEEMSASLDPITESIFLATLNSLNGNSDFLTPKEWSNKILPFLPWNFFSNESDISKATAVGSTFSRLKDKVTVFNDGDKLWHFKVNQKSATGGGNNKAYSVTSVTYLNGKKVDEKNESEDYF